MPTAKQLAERVGFEPTVRITAQRLSSSKILMLGRIVQKLNVCSCSTFSGERCRLVMPGTLPGHGVRCNTVCNPRCRACPLLRVRRTSQRTVRCLLLTQSGHAEGDSITSVRMNRRHQAPRLLNADVWDGSPKAETCGTGDCKTGKPSCGLAVEQIARPE